MLDITNRVRQAYEEGRPSFGAYIATPSPQMVELLGCAGLDFVRIDMGGTEIYEEHGFMLLEDS